MNKTLSSRTRKAELASWLFALCGVWMIGLGAYFALLRPALLPEDLRFVQLSVPSVQSAAPALTAWLRHVFTVMGGFMASAGLVSFYFARTAVRSRAKGAGPGMFLAGLLSLGLMSGVNFALHSDYRWWLLAPAALWAAAVFLYWLAPARPGA